MTPPEVQFALLHSIGAASLFFVLLRLIKDMKEKAKDRPQYISCGRSFLWGIFFLTATWVLTAFYICIVALFIEAPDEIGYFENILWVLGFVGVIYASIGIFALLIKGEFYTYLSH
ncbi:MAG: hypothetical protein KAT65_12545 [Methanophagales archaeon]|nr:hypothetical protein [Methanophagales archaeon]